MILIVVTIIIVIIIIIAIIIIIIVIIINLSFYRGFVFLVEKRNDIFISAKISKFTDNIKSNKNSIIHGLSIKTEKINLFFDCLDPVNCSNWFNCLQR